MRTNAACVTGTMFRMRFCKIAKPKPAASLAYQPPRSRLSCATASAGILQQWVEVATTLAEGELIERHVARVIVKPQALEVCLVPTCETSAQAEDHGLDNLASCHPPTTITLPWTAPSFAAVKGIVHAPCAKPAMRPESRDALLIAIAKARGWIDDIRLGRIGSFAEIAEREGQGERHIRLLAPLAFLSPRIIAAIVDGTAPADLTVTGLAKALPYSWIEQEQRVGL
jgi:site-specific DNA recombinase